MSIEPDLEATSYCNLCAQQIVAALENITPKAQKQITYDMGCIILDVLQKELYQRV